MKSWVTAETVRWAGHAWVGPGIGVFYGRAGHQEWHLHQAHQISVGLDSTVSVQTPMGIQTGGAIFIPAGLKHQLSAGHVLSIYVDALSEEARALRGAEEARVIWITPADVAPIVDALHEPGHTDLQVRTGVRQALRLPDLPPPDPRLIKVIEALSRGQIGRGGASIPHAVFSLVRGADGAAASQLREMVTSHASPAAFGKRCTADRRGS